MFGASASASARKKTTTFVTPAVGSSKVDADADADSDTESEVMEIDPPMPTQTKPKADADVLMAHVGSADSSMTNIRQQMPPPSAPLVGGHPAVALIPATPETSQEEANYVKQTLLPATAANVPNSRESESALASALTIARSTITDPVHLSPPAAAVPSSPPPHVASTAVDLRSPQSSRQAALPPASMNMSLPFSHPVGPTPTPPTCGQPRPINSGRPQTPPLASGLASDMEISPRPPSVQRIPAQRGRGRGRGLQVPLVPPRRSSRLSPSPTRNSELPSPQSGTASNAHIQGSS